MILRRTHNGLQICQSCWRRAFSDHHSPPSQNVGNNSKSRKVVFSGIQPTGSLHLGNYFGAVKLWRELQEDPQNQLIISVVDMHAMTMPWNSAKLRNDVRQMFIELIACGIDPDRTILFQQSRVPEHAQLQWILSCYTTMARLDNLPQFKEKSTGQKEIPCGLFMYPVLQAADILLYRSDLVPVGEDQVQHLQLAAHIAKIFNHKHGDFFPTPKRLHTQVPRLKSLRDPSKKMSKSDPDRKSRIEFTDTPEEIQEKLAKSVTDSIGKLEWDPHTRPQLASLLNLYQAVSGAQMDVIMQRLAGKNKVAFKKELSELIVGFLRPIQEKVRLLGENFAGIENVVESGSEKAKLIAGETMRQVRDLTGLTTDLRK